MHCGLEDVVVVHACFGILVIKNVTTDGFGPYGNLHEFEAEEILQTRERFVLFEDEIFEADFNPLFGPGGRFDEIVLVTPRVGAAFADVVGLRILDAECSHIIRYMAADDAVPRVAYPEDVLRLGEDA